MTERHAWSNGYEVVAAKDEEEARGVLLAIAKIGAANPSSSMIDESEIDGDGWRMLPDDKRPIDEDGNPDPQTFLEYVLEKDEARHLFSLEP